jgi:hypothetical protein
MGNMFRNAIVFNQDLSPWCVTLIPTVPLNFATGANVWVLPQPIWGTCPLPVTPTPTPTPTLTPTGTPASVTPTPTGTQAPTPTPTTLSCLCREATISNNNAYFYTDCQGNLYTGGAESGTTICLDINQPYSSNIQNIIESPYCTCSSSTPTPTPTPTTTPGGANISLFGKTSSTSGGPYYMWYSVDSGSTFTQFATALTTSCVNVGTTPLYPIGTTFIFYMSDTNDPASSGGWPTNATSAGGVCPAITTLCTEGDITTTTSGTLTVWATGNQALPNAC